MFLFVGVCWFPLIFCKFCNKKRFMHLLIMPFDFGNENLYVSCQKLPDMKRSAIALVLIVQNYSPISVRRAVH